MRYRRGGGRGDQTLIKPLPTEPGATAVEEVIIGDMTFEVLKMYLTASES